MKTTKETEQNDSRVSEIESFGGHEREKRRWKVKTKFYKNVQVRFKHFFRSLGFKLSFGNIKRDKRRWKIKKKFHTNNQV